MALKIGVVIDPWDYPYNGTVVSTRRFVTAMDQEFEFKLLATPNPCSEVDRRIYPFPKLSIPGFNRIIDKMKVPLANPWGRESVLDSLKDVDLVHMQFPFFLGIMACRAAKRLKMPLVCSFHVQPENLLHNLNLRSETLSNWLYWVFIHLMYRHADLVLAPSEFAAQQLRKHGLTVPIEVLSNGVPEVFFGENQTAVGDQASDKFQLLSVGRMAPEKHHELMLEAVARSKHKDSIQLWLVGTGPLEDQLKAQMDDLRLDAQIGRVDDETLIRLYQHADLFVHAGEIELEGMSVLEAMAASTVVLVSNSRNSAAGELAHGKNTLFEADSVEDLSSKIDYWIEHPELRQEQAANNRISARLKHHDRSVQQLKDIYRSAYETSIGAHRNG